MSRTEPDEVTREGAALGPSHFRFDYATWFDQSRGNQIEGRRLHSSISLREPKRYTETLPTYFFRTGGDLSHAAILIDYAAERTDKLNRKVIVKDFIKFAALGPQVAFHLIQHSDIDADTALRVRLSAADDVPLHPRSYPKIANGMPVEWATKRDDLLGWFEPSAPIIPETGKEPEPDPTIQLWADYFGARLSWRS